MGISNGTRMCLAGAAAGALAAGALTAVSAPAQAAKSGTCSGFTVSTGGHTLRGDQDRVIRAGQVGERITVSGRYVRFSVVPSTFETRNYTLTGANSSQADKNLPLSSPSVVFTSKRPLHGQTLTGPVSLDISNEGVVLERSGGGQDMKIQAKNCAQGGLFQMEPEPGVAERNTLGADYRFTQQRPDGPLCITHVDGRFSAYDSPELATLASNSATHSRWRVSSGGRIGFVVGEDAVEGGCSAQRIG
jgi:hypothetical protein